MKKVWPNGTEEWFDIRGRCHRDDDLPASVSTDGAQAWFRHGKLHRENSPAFIDKYGRVSFWLNGECIDDEDIHRVIVAPAA